MPKVDFPDDHLMSRHGLTHPAGLKILERLHAHPTCHITTREEFMQIHKQTKLERSQKVSNLIQLLMHLTYRQCMCHGFFFQCLAQMTGILVINNYQVRRLGVVSRAWLASSGSSLHQSRTLRCRY